MQRRVRIFLADDHEVFAEGLRVVLESEPDLQVVGVAHDGPSTVRLLSRQPADVLILDVHMPASDIAVTVRDARERDPDLKVLVLSGDPRAETIARVVEAGVDGFIAKDVSSRNVIAAIRRLAEGQQGTFSSPVAARPAPARKAEVELLVRTLSPRERHVLGLLAAGHANRRIAEECFLSLNTVRTHVQNILVKLGVHSKLEAAAFAVQHGIVQAGGDPIAASGAS